MTRLDILSALDQFKKVAGRNPTTIELDRIKQAVITVPITTAVDDYLEYWEGEMVGISSLTAEPAL
jgi:hypothetical protein